MTRMIKGIMVLITLCLISGCKDKMSLLINDYRLNVNESESCNDKKLYTNIDGKNIYLKCIDEVLLEKDNDNITLKEYLDNNDFKTFITELEKQVEPTIYKDGGTKVYKSNNITIVVCKNMIDTDNYIEDVYFGNSELTYNNTCV